ncbi:dopamine beta-hydroxylase-like [Oppia nitens]|uniref:dopamine beta-hydroxylase-like n=1 Tax=Oppia nitens TaxID=1686743 RepID=UPI0023DA9F8C|nr:dopamine beta-hydroxylase-like [Oppia nitens]
MFSPLIFLFYFHFNHQLLQASIDTINNSDDERLLSSSQPQPLTTNITFQTALDADDRYRLFWTVDYETQSVTMELRLVLADINDWFAIGFSDYGDIRGADMCMFWTDRRHGKHRKTHFQDIHTDNNSFVFVDDLTNDCKLLSIERKHHILRFAYHRDFDTCDPNDYIIEEGTTHIVYATGKGGLQRIDGLRLTDHKYGYQRVQLLKKLETMPKLPSNTRRFDLLNDRVSIPNVETTYWCRLLKLPKEFKDTKHHIIQYEAVIDSGNEALVHHMELFHCEVSAEDSLSDYSGNCFAPEKPAAMSACSRVISAWAMGAGPLVYPKQTGLPVGGRNYSLYVMLEIHYNNPEQRDDWIDGSGIRLYYTQQLRQHDAGILEIGLEYSAKNSIPPGQQSFDLSGYCTAECTRSGLPVYGINIFASQLHTHLTGTRVWTRHIRGGVELTEINRDNHYSPHFQEIRKLKQQVTIFPGDVLINTCRFDTRGRVNMTLGGHAITDEMCVNYLHYYPKTQLEVCKSSMDTQYLRSYFRYMNAREGQSTLASNGSVRENFQSIHWNPNRVQFLDRLYRLAPLSMQCNQSSGQRFPGYWNGMPIPQIHFPLEETPRKHCTKN